MIKIAAGILAGGKSSRMGSDKASLTWNGNTFLHTLLDVCRDFPEIYVSVDDRKSTGILLKFMSQRTTGKNTGICIVHLWRMRKRDTDRWKVSIRY